MTISPSFSEFTYGFAFTHELVVRHNKRITAPPLLPSLKQEGRSGGFDVALKFSRARALFLQFKLPELVGHPRGGQWSHFGRPYYRFWIAAPKRRRQHGLLLRLEKRGRVYYAAPEFHTSVEFSQRFESSSVEYGSALFRPRDMGHIADGRDHCVAYTMGTAFGYFCSEPARMRNWGGGRLTQAIEGIAADSALPVVTPDTLDAFVAALLDDALSDLSEAEAQEQKPALIRDDPLERFGLVCRLYYGVEPFLVRVETNGQAEV